MPRKVRPCQLLICPWLQEPDWACFSTAATAPLEGEPRLLGAVQMSAPQNCRRARGVFIRDAMRYDRARSPRTALLIGESRGKCEQPAR
jgi:hypothetical protein